MLRRFLRISVVALAAAAVPAAGASCLESGSGAVSITGTLIQKPLGSPTTLRWLIRLETSMCVDPASDRANDGDELDHVRVVELMVTAQRMQSDFYLIGRRVTAKGFISTQQAGHQQPIVRLEVTSLEAAH
jgi:hypothetical protein